MARRLCDGVSLIPRRVYINCGTLRSAGVPGEKNESDGCEFVRLCNEMVGISDVF